MTETNPDTIDEKVARVEEIIDTLEAGEVSLGEAKSLRDEGKELLEELEGDPDAGDGSIIETYTPGHNQLNVFVAGSPGK